MTAYVSAELRRQVGEDAGHRCGYCLSDELLTGVPLTVDHIVPTAKAGATVRSNLWLACRPCNEFKGIETHALDSQTGELAALFNPRKQAWTDHFAWSSDGTQVLGMTSTGRATVVVQTPHPTRKPPDHELTKPPSTNACGATNLRRMARLRIRAFVAPFVDGLPSRKRLDHEIAKEREGTKHEMHEDARGLRVLRASCLRVPSRFRDPNPP